MDKAVQVGLVFPRSGQQVLVHLAPAHAERLGVRHSDGNANAVTLTHPIRAKQGNESTHRTQ